jgi:hypothetical protein
VRSIIIIAISRNPGGRRRRRRRVGAGPDPAIADGYRGRGPPEPRTHSDTPISLLISAWPTGEQFIRSIIVQDKWYIFYQAGTYHVKR